VQGLVGKEVKGTVEMEIHTIAGQLVYKRVVMER